MSSRISFDLRSDLISVIYGVGGQTVDRIESIYGVEVSIRGSELDEGCDTVTIRGDQTHVNGAKEYVMALYDQAEDQRSIRVSPADRDRLVGVNGDRRMELEKLSSTQISVENGVASIRGTAAACSSAVLMIRDYIRFFRELEKRKMELKDYDSLPYGPVKLMLKQYEESSAPETREACSTTELIEYAVQTGFSECQAREAIKRMGNSVSANNLLTTLMNMYPQKNKGRKTPDAAARTTCHQSNETRTIGETSESCTDTESANERNGGPRTVVIDGSNVAMSYSNGQYFACVALRKVVDYFQNLGHDKITVFVPQWRNEKSRPEAPIEDQHILDELKASQQLVFTPSRRLKGKRITPYDDQFIVQLAAQRKGVIVSNDFFRDLVNERKDWKETIETRLLQYCWADGIFMPAGDPLGRGGPALRDFLRFPTEEVEVSTGRQFAAAEADHNTPVCKYGRTCTRGPSCAYRHPGKNESNKKAGSKAKAESHPPSRFTTMSSADSSNYFDLTSRAMPASDAPTEVCHIPDGLVSFVQKPDGDAREKGMPQPPPPPSYHPCQGYDYETGYPDYASEPFYGRVGYGAHVPAPYLAHDQSARAAYYYGHHQPLPYGQPPAQPPHQYYGQHGGPAYSSHQYAAMDYDSQYAQHAVPDYQQQQAAATSGHPLPPPPPTNMRYGAMADGGDMPSQSRFQTVPEHYQQQFEQEQPHYDHDTYSRNAASSGGYATAGNAASSGASGGYATAGNAASSGASGSYATAGAAAAHPDAALSDADVERTVQEFLQTSYLHKELTRAGKIHCREELARSTLKQFRGHIYGMDDLVCYIKFTLKSASPGPGSC